MVFRHITSQGTVQGEKVDTPHAHSDPAFSHIGTDGHVMRTPPSPLLSSSAIDPKTCPAESDTIIGGPSASNGTPQARKDQDSEGLNDVKDNSTRGKDSLGCTEVSGGSWVVNGDVKDKSKPYSARSHIMEGGKVTRESWLVNGDMDPDTFIEAFCRPR